VNGKYTRKRAQKLSCYTVDPNSVPGDQGTDRVAHVKFLQSVCKILWNADSTFNTAKEVITGKPSTSDRSAVGKSRHVDLLPTPFADYNK